MVRTYSCWLAIMGHYHYWCSCVLLFRGDGKTHHQKDEVEDLKRPLNKLTSSTYLRYKMSDLRNL